MVSPMTALGVAGLLILLIAVLVLVGNEMCTHFELVDFSAEDKGLYPDGVLKVLEVYEPKLLGRLIRSKRKETLRVFRKQMHGWYALPEFRRASYETSARLRHVMEKRRWETTRKFNEN